MAKKYIVPVFIPHMGCPQDCVFCNQHRIARERPPAAKDVHREIEGYLEHLPDKKADEIAFYGGSFTGIGNDLMEEYLAAGKEWIDRGAVRTMRCSTRPDYIDEDVLFLLKKYGLTTVELGVQSTDDDVLRKNNRGHGSGAVQKAVDMLRSEGFLIGLQMMTGLYGSDLSKDLKTAEDFVDLGADFVRIYPTLVIKDTPLEDLYREGLYRPKTLEESAEETAKIYRVFIDAGIPVIRIGLQPTEELSSGGVVAGPYHPAYRQLAESVLLYDFFTEELKNIPDGDIVIGAPPRYLSAVVGQHGRNRKRWKKLFPGKKLSFREGETFFIEGDGKRRMYNKEEVIG